MIKPNLHLFHGQDTYSAWHKSQYWRKEFEKKFGDFNVLMFDGEKLTPADFIEAVDSIPFLGEKKFVLIRDFLRDGNEADQKAVAEKLEDVADFSLVLFVEQDKPDARTTLFKTLKKLATVVEFEPLIGPQLSAWVQTQVQQQGGQIGPKEAHQLAETVGPNLWQMTHEIEKLATYANGKPIPAEAIESMVSPNLTTTIFKLTDYLGQRNAKAALKTLNIMLENGEEIVRIMFTLAGHFRTLIQVRACMERKMDKATITQKIKKHPYVIQTTMGQCKNFDTALLTKIHGKFLAIDTNMKSSKIHTTAGDNTELRLALEKLMTELCLRSN